MKVAAPTHKHALTLIAGGHALVAGIDEVGRGCWAGPVVAGAVILPLRSRLTGVTDSKLLTAKQRASLDGLIRQRAVAIGLGWVEAAELDEHGLSWAVKESGLRALADLRHPYDAVLLDGSHNYLAGHCYSQAIIKGDQLSLSIAAASIIAKVARDQYMIEQNAHYPAYNFAANKGYGTQLHQTVLAREGLTPLHRRSFKPVQLIAATLTT